ncbi:MAG TPA: hypothetical protein DD979_14005 [Gammaproteobacteria bacterium]|jgi:chromosome segregation ATPase|nr:hypothetical protein [Gammaproteobacteria bacterium]
MNDLYTHPLFVVPVAALLGAIIGWSTRRIMALRQVQHVQDEMKSKLRGRDRYIAELKDELQEAEEDIELQSSALEKTLEEQGSEAEEQRALAEEYQVRMRAAEGKLMKIQRNYLVFKTHKEREIEQLQTSLQKVLPLRRELQSRIEEMERNEPEVDMDATLELDSEMRDEQNPFILRNALVSEKRKVEQLSTVKKELSDTYFRFAEEKQQWSQERASLEQRLTKLEAVIIDRDPSSREA